MARTKNCARVKPDSPQHSSSPSPAPTNPPPPPIPRVTTPAYKNVPSAPSLFSPASSSAPPSALPPIVGPPSAIPPIVAPPSASPQVVAPPSAPRPQIIIERPRKKITYPGPFIKGQVGTVYFSLDKIRSYMEIPHGYSIIVSNFHLRCKYESCFSKYVIIDPIGNKWEAPEVFEKWRQCVETNTIADLDLNKTRLAIVRYGNNFKLCTSVKKNSYKDQMHLVPVVELAEEDPREKKDPDYIPTKDSDEED